MGVTFKPDDYEVDEISPILGHYKSAETPSIEFVLRRGIDGIIAERWCMSYDGRWKLEYSSPFGKTNMGQALLNLQGRGFIPSDTD